MNQMSDDLISRKALIADMKSRKYIDKALCEIFETVVDEAPKAFDKEKVIEELKNNAEDSRKYWSEFDDECAFGEMNAYTRAIEIVEKGGIE